MSRSLKPPSLKKTYLKLGLLGNIKIMAREHIPKTGAPTCPPASLLDSVMRYLAASSLAVPSLALSLVACTGIEETRVFAGPQTPQAGTCEPATRATLTRRGMHVVVTPGDGTVTLDGQIEASAIVAKAMLTGADKKPYPLIFTGQLHGTTIDGTLATQRCRYALALSLTDD